MTRAKKAEVTEVLDAEPAPPAKPARKPRGKPLPKGTRKINGLRLDNHLTPQQEAYCRARAMGMTPQEAIVTAGLSITVHCARDWERTLPHLRDRIGELTAMATQSAILKTGLDREWVISRLMSVVDRCMTAEPVKDNKGNPTGEFRFDSAGANTALKMLGDTLGLFKPAEKKPEDDYANLSDADLARIAQELAAQTGLLEVPAGDQAAPGPQ